MGNLQCVTVEDAVAYTGLDREALYARIPRVVLGKRTHRFRMADLDAYMNIGNAHLEELRRSIDAGRIGRVYFAEADGAERVKIGWTAKPIQTRLSDLQTGCPFPLKLLHAMPGTRATEMVVHARFEKHRVMPQAEWFHGVAEIRAYADFMGSV